MRSRVIFIRQLPVTVTIPDAGARLGVPASAAIRPPKLYIETSGARRNKKWETRRGS
jgi:hypothetical protein